MGLIRPATAADASCLAALAIEVWLSTYIKRGVTPLFADYALDRFTPDRFRAWIADPNQHIYVSQNDEGIDGYVHLDKASPDPSGHQTELVSLYIQPRHQGSGVGRALMEATQAHRPFWLFVNAENERALAFYAAQGFTKIGKTAFEIGDQAYPNDILLAP